MTDIFLGEPPADIKTWIIEHQGPAGHAETRFTLSDGTVATHDIPGTLNQQWMINNGYYDDDNRTWEKTITQADIGNTVTSIDDQAFQDCDQLTSVIIPDSVTNIGYAVFQYCVGLMSMTIPNSVTSIGADAFSYCTNITNVTLPNSITSIGNSAFSTCDNLTSVTIVANGGNTENVKQMLINAGVNPNITWN